MSCVHDAYTVFRVSVCNTPSSLLPISSSMNLCVVTFPNSYSLNYWKHIYNILVLVGTSFANRTTCVCLSQPRFDAIVVECVVARQNGDGISLFERVQADTAWTEVHGSTMDAKGQRYSLYTEDGMSAARLLSFMTARLRIMRLL